MDRAADAGNKVARMIIRAFSFLRVYYPRKLRFIDPRIRPAALAREVYLEETVFNARDTSYSVSVTRF